MKLPRLLWFSRFVRSAPLGWSGTVALAIAVAGPLAAAPPAHAAADAPLVLADGWSLQTSAKVTADGAAISQPNFAPKDWHTISVPATVVSALVKNKVYPDPNFGMNMRDLPGANYKMASNFSSSEMDPASPFAVPWWYRKTFNVPAGWKGKTIWLKFDALNYRANIWLNGQKLGDAKDIAGAWRVFDLNATSLVLPGKENVLAVEVFSQKRTDLGITFVDWNPTAPDKNMGLWRKVSLRATGPVVVRSPAVMTKLSGISDEAALTVAAVVQNGSDKTVTGILRGRIEDVTFEQSVTLDPGEVKDVAFEATKYPQLVFKKPRLWWPAQMGKPEMYEVQLGFAASRGLSGSKGTGMGEVVLGVVTDTVKQSFGIRESQSAFDDKGRLYFTINNKKVLIRGGGWSSNIMMREDVQRQQDELRYVQDMGLNTVRLEGKLEDEPFLEYADRNGILIMAGWCCCDAWERWKEWTDTEMEISAASLRDQLLRLRMHPSVFTWMNGSDKPPPARVEKRYFQVAREVRWPNPVQSSATAAVAELSGPSGVKMMGPYDWVPPRYWFEDTKRGGAYGFNTETGPGPAIPPIESMRLMLPADKLWPLNEQWTYHAGGGQFAKLDIYNAALENRYGKAVSLEDYTHKGQLMAYEGIRAMFEAFTRNKYASTGVIQWMLNNAWPSVIWHLYDYYLRPGGGYFGAKVAHQPYHPIYAPNDGSISVANSTYVEKKGLKLVVKVLNLDMTEAFSREVPVNLPADGVERLFVLPAAATLAGISPTYFIDMRLYDDKGAKVGGNFYWESTQPDKLDYTKGTWYHTPHTGYSNFTALADLPKVTLERKVATRRQADRGITTIKLTNPSKSLAFFVRLKLNKGKQGDEVLPVLWTENYVSLLPGETREVAASYRQRDLGGQPPVIELVGSNLAPENGGGAAAAAKSASAP